MIAAGPHLLKRIALACAGLFVALAAQRLLGSGASRDAALLFALAAALYLVAFPRATEPLALGAQPLARSRTLVAAGLLLCAAAIVLTAAALPRFTIDKPEPWGWTLHLAAVGAVVLGGLCLDLGLRAPAQARVHTLGPLLGLLLLTVLASVLRLQDLGDFPFGIWYDEAENALVAQSILRDPTYRPFYLGSTFHTAHHNYLVAAAFAWLGETIAGARLVSALMGILMVPAGYLAASELFFTMPSHGDRASFVPPLMGLAFAAILTLSSWALNFSRIAVNYIATPFFILLAVGFLLRGLRTQRMGAYLTSGLALGMGLNFYTSFRLVAPVLPLFALAALVARRDLWGKSLRGLLVLSLAALVVAGPLLTFALNNRDDFLSRSRNTFLLKDLPPELHVTALLGNTSTHLLMFNVRGDPNGRHNLPGRPMLDPVLGAFFVVGMAVCLWRWRRPTYLLLPLWLGFGLLGGILTLDFEAPQSLRANGAMPAAYLIALVPLAEILRAWERSDGGRYAPSAAHFAVALLLLPITGWHIHQFYDVQRNDFASWNAFSTAETLVARTLATLDPEQSEAYLISYYAGHPTVHFVAPHWRERYRRIESTEAIPLVWPPDKDIWLFLDPDSRVLLQKLHAIYPSAEFTDHTPPFNQTVTMHEVHLTRAVLDSVQGLEARYYGNNEWDGEPVRVQRVQSIDTDWSAQPPVPLPFSVEYEGILRVTSYGLHRFRLTAPGRAELLIGETRVLAGRGDLAGAVVLAQGNHTIRVRAVGGADAIRLIWRPPERDAEILPAGHLFTDPVTANGLLGRFFPNADWQPPETLATIDPQINIIYHITPLSRPFTVEWSGKIAIPETGDYLLSVQAIDTVRLELDGELVALAKNGQMTVDGTVRLESGLHDIRILYAALTSHSRVDLFWTPPGGARAPVPSIALFPPQGNYDRVAVPSFAMLNPAPVVVEGGSGAPGAGSASLGPLLPGAPETLVTDLNRPSGVAAGPDGRLYVVDTLNARVLVVAPNGGIERTITGGLEPFGEPFDVAVHAVDSSSEVFVLDAADGKIVVLDGAGEPLRTLRPAPELTGRSRGLAVDAEGQIWIANTPGQRIVVLDGAGAPVRDFPAWPGEEAQVVDVAVTADGRVFATVLGINKLVEYDALGQRLMAWDLPPANTMDGPHLAVDAAGTLYVTQPEESRVVLIGPDGTRVGHWQLPQTPPMVKPVGVGVDRAGRLLVTDTEGGRVLAIDAVLERDTAEGSAEDSAEGATP